jgi:antirestriction protein
MRVYITDLSAYNQGFLVGEWIELEIDEDELNQSIKRILKLGEEACDDGDIHEEYLLTDWEGEEFFQVEEYTDVYELNKEVARFNELDLDDSQKKCVSFLMSENIVLNLDDAIDKSEEVIIYEDFDFEKLSYQIADEIYCLDNYPQFVSNYFDYEALARDLELEGFYHEIDGDIFYYPY